MKYLSITILTLFLCSCSSGVMFNHKKASELDLQQIRSDQYIAIFGEPFRTTNLVTSDGKYKYVWYYSELRDHFIIGNVARRTLLLEFKDDQLNGYLYGSSFDDDKTLVDLSKVNMTKIGKSTKDDVISLLGKPSGKALCPSALRDFKDSCSKASEIWAWWQFEKKNSIRNFDLRGSKTLFVIFDTSGQVIDLKATDNEQ